MSFRLQSEPRTDQGYGVTSLIKSSKFDKLLDLRSGV
jgi:hypothetical protein